jgi:hypothetical protein
MCGSSRANVSYAVARELHEELLPAAAKAAGATSTAETTRACSSPSAAAAARTRASVATKLTKSAAAAAATTTAAEATARRSAAAAATAAKGGGAGLASGTGQESFWFSKAALAQLYHAELLHSVYRRKESGNHPSSSSSTPAAAAAAAGTAGSHAMGGGSDGRFLSGLEGSFDGLPRSGAVKNLLMAASQAWVDSSGKIVTTLQIEVKKVCYVAMREVI